MLEPAEGEGLEDGGGRTPTRDMPELRPLACTAALLPAATVGSSTRLRVGDRAALRKLGTRRPGCARIPGGAPSPGSRPGSTCARPYWIHCPSHCLRAGAAGKERGRAEPGFSFSPEGVLEPNWPAGEAGRTPGKITTSKGSTPSSQPALALPNTHPRALTPRKQSRRPAPAAALVAQAPPAGGSAAIPGAQAAAGQRPWGRRGGREAGRWSWVLT